MYLEKLIRKLKQAKCITNEERRNVDINIKLSEMQIRIRNKYKKKL